MCIFKLILFIYIWLAGSSLLCRLFSSCSEQGLLSSWGVWASHCGSFSCCRIWALGHTGFSSCSTWVRSCGSWALEHRFSICDAWDKLLHGMWNPPGPGIEPVSPELAGRLFTTESPGKPGLVLWIYLKWQQSLWYEDLIIHVILLQISPLLVITTLDFINIFCLLVPAFIFSL